MSSRRTAGILMACGAEEIELTICADVLRRAGVDVTLVSLEGAKATICQHGTQIRGDVGLEFSLTKSFDMIIVPGGPSCLKLLCQEYRTKTFLDRHEQRGSVMAAIGHGPGVFKHFGLGRGKRFTSHPEIASEFMAEYQYMNHNVVIDGKFITSRAPGTAFEFALTLAEAMMGEKKRMEIQQPMLVRF